MCSVGMSQIATRLSMNAIVAVLLFSTLATTFAKLDQYCSICSDHTMCKYQGYGNACEAVGEGGVTEDEKRLIVDLHNWYRKLIAGGFEKRGLGGAQPNGANLMKMTWDEELARVAQKWADQCLFQHDSCRDVARWKVGQNIYWSWRIPIIKETNWTAAVESWYDEVEKFSPKNVEKYKFEAATGHYTQLIWHDTTYLGCGRRNYGPNKLYVCNYGPAGNWINDPVYAIGAPCSQCPQGTTCNEGLCEGSPVAATPQLQALNVPNNPPSLIKQSLTPPLQNAQDTYSAYVKKGIDSTANKFNLIDDGALAEEEETTTTEADINLNVIDQLEFIAGDEEIKKEIEDLKKKILELAKKIIEKRKAQN